MNLSDEDVQYPDASIGVIVEGNSITGNLFGVYVWNFGLCPAPATAITFSDNQIGGNDTDQYCAEWECGVGKKCK